MAPMHTAATSSRGRTFLRPATPRRKGGGRYFSIGDPLLFVEVPEPMGGLREDLQARLEKFLRALGARETIVELKVIGERRCLAGAQGMMISGVAVGRVFVSLGILSRLSREEIDFVLAHEAAHICLNHLPVRMLVDSLQGAILAFGARSPLALSAAFLAELAPLGRG
ncbi:hypothetical protein B6U99_04565 [Candidatus Geothermarchaeota archaeon ex4572_27]|nr:MAG: hypothetical protein B6U99_04565 [Candidatus Geothermarchaeota archaeon ex4572_27]